MVDRVEIAQLDSSRRRFQVQVLFGSAVGMSRLLVLVAVVRLKFAWADAASVERPSRNCLKLTS